MKSIITLVFLFNFSIQANTFEATKNVFNSLLTKNDTSYGEFTLALKTLDFSNDEYIEMNKVTSSLLEDSFSEGLEEIQMNAIYEEDVESVISTLKLGNGFYCAMFAGLEDYSWDRDERCVVKTKELILGLVKDQTVDAVKFLRIAGNYYGMWETIYLIGLDHETNQAVVIELDIIHEI